MHCDAEVTESSTNKQHHLFSGRGGKRPEFPRCFRTLVVKVKKSNSNSTRDFSKGINLKNVHPRVGSTFVVKIKKTQESTPSIPVNAKKE
jgi:hypothetical protein